MKPTPLDPTEAHIIANATRFYVTTPETRHRRGFGSGGRDILKVMHFALSDACDYARWLASIQPALRNRLLVYASQHDQPHAPSAAQQWRSVLVPKEYWI